jgi:hypothetical protein
MALENKKKNNFKSTNRLKVSDRSFPSKPSTKLLRVVPNSIPPPSFATVRTRLLGTLKNLSLANEELENNITQSKIELNGLSGQEQVIRNQVEKTEEKREWYEEFKARTDEWGEFLDEKVS